MVSGDTAGQMKMWDISGVDFDIPETKRHFNEKYFIIAHKSVINTIEIIENPELPAKFIVTASQDSNINLHRLDTGVKIGQFGKGWNIHDMSPYENKKPRYVRAWYLMLKARLAELRGQASKKRPEKLEWTDQRYFNT